MNKLIIFKNRITDLVLQLQPLFAAPLYFTVLTNNPPLWLSLIISSIPFLVRYRQQHIFIKKTPFDIPILIFIIGMFVGFFVAANKEVAVGTLISTLASLMIYYGIVNNCNQGKKYWMSFAIILIFICFGISAWFFSQGWGRHFWFNQWAFELFNGLPKTSGPTFNLNGVGALLAVVIPLLFSIVLFKNNIILRLVALLFGFIFLEVLFMSTSGGGFVSVVFGLSFILICWRLWMIGIVIPVTGSVAIAVFFFYDKLTWVKDAFLVQDMQGRLLLWVNTIPLIHSYHFITGIGLGSWYELYNRVYKTGQIFLHNSYFQLYVDTGIIGIAALVCGIVVFFNCSKIMLSASRHSSLFGIKIGLIGSIIAGAAMALVDVATFGVVVTNSGYIYLNIPLLWVFLALFTVAFNRSDYSD